MRKESYWASQALPSCWESGFCDFVSAEVLRLTSTCSRAGVHHNVTVVRTACPRSTATAQPVLVTAENPDSPTPGLNDPDNIDAASSSSHEPPLSKDPSPSAAPPCEQVVALPGKLGGFDLNEKQRIVTMIADIDVKHYSKIYGIIEKHQPTLLCASSEINIQASLLIHRVPLLLFTLTLARLF